MFAAQEAVKGFKQLDGSASRTFILTGNMLNHIAKPDVLTFGMGKSASASLIWTASVAYEKHGFKWVSWFGLIKFFGNEVLTTDRFYYADERQANGGPTIPVSGPAAAEAYIELAEKEEQGPWNYTFMEGKGYVEFKGPLPTKFWTFAGQSPHSRAFSCIQIECYFEVKFFWKGTMDMSRTVFHPRNCPRRSGSSPSTSVTGCFDSIRTHVSLISQVKQTYHPSVLLYSELKLILALSYWFKFQKPMVRRRSCRQRYCPQLRLEGFSSDARTIASLYR